MALQFSMLSEPDLGVMPGTTGQVDPSSAYPIAGTTGLALGTGTSQHGIAPLLSGGGGFAGAIEDLWQWLNRPFTTPMDPVSVMLLVGVIMLSVIIWNFILYHIRIAAESI
jgi:hypothetical protein